MQQWHGALSGAVGVSELLERMKELVAKGQVRVSEHGYEELADDGVTVREAIAGIHGAFVVEEYPQYPKGPSVLVLQYERDGSPIHIVWGIPKEHDTPVASVTGYRPDPARWDEKFMTRR